MADSSNVKAVFLDAGNTLIHSHPTESDVLANIALDHGYSLDRPALLSAMDRSFQRLERMTVADASFWANSNQTRAVWSDLYETTLHDVGVDGAAPSIAKSAISHYSSSVAWRAYPEVRSFLSSLQELGLTIGIVSNWDGSLPSILDGLELTEYFDFVISSGLVGHPKPYPEIFREALKRAGVKPNEAIHIGDHYFSDILGAKSVGIQGVLLDRKGSHQSIADCLKVGDLTQALKLLA